jgi:putative nucleotidyltransferase with HDIG domain
MLANIKAHSELVAKVAHLIARRLRAAGINVSVQKATAGALMHDIGKTVSLDTGQDHAELGRRICVQDCFEEIAEIVGEHVRLKNADLDAPCSEKEIVYYADKRVNHDKIVSLESRLAYILRRYGRSQEALCRRIRDNFEFCRQVEGKLFSKLNFDPGRLPHLAKEEEIV